MTRLTLLPCLAATLTGCSLFGPGNITEDNWAESFAKTYCKQLEECQKGYFESEYSDLADCEDEMKDDIEDAADAADDADCNFEEDEAQDCVDSMHTSSCEDFYDLEYLDDCDEVYDCDGGSEATEEEGTQEDHDGEDSSVDEGRSLTGSLAVYANGNSGAWSLSGVTGSCSNCQLTFDAEFTSQDGGEIGGDFYGSVTIDAYGYTYWNGDTYWGRGYVGSSSAGWAGYSSSDYYYSGSVSF